MRPTDLPTDMALALAHRRATALRAVRLLQHAAVQPDVVDPDRAVAHAVRLLRGRHRVARRPAVPAQRRPPC